MTVMKYIMTLLNYITLHNSTFVVTCVYRSHEMDCWLGYLLLCLFKEVLAEISVTWFKELHCALHLLQHS